MGVVFPPHREAGHAWEKALRLLLRCKDSEELRMWWKEKEGGGGGGKEMQRCGTTGVMLAAILAVKIARLFTQLSNNQCEKTCKESAEINSLKFSSECSFYQHIERSGGNVCMSVHFHRYVHANKANVSLQYLLTASALFKVSTTMHEVAGRFTCHVLEQMHSITGNCSSPSRVFQLHPSLTSHSPPSSLPPPPPHIPHPPTSQSG